MVTAAAGSGGGADTDPPASTRFTATGPQVPVASAAVAINAVATPSAAEASRWFPPVGPAARAPKIMLKV
jgi:hypothetical protein